jgi:hypothetical protein
MEKIEEQIKNTYEKAFFDLLEEKVKQEPPDYNWITKLYAEIKDKLTKLLKNTSSLHKEMNESLDVQLFDQMIRNNAFNGVDFYNLILYVFEKIKQFGSPQRDQECDEKRDEIFELMKNNATFAQIVPVFIKNSNFCIDKIYEDMHYFLNHPISKNIPTLKK